MNDADKEEVKGIARLEAGKVAFFVMALAWIFMWTVSHIHDELRGRLSALEKQVKEGRP